MDSITKEILETINRINTDEKNKYRDMTVLSREECAKLLQNGGYEEPEPSAIIAPENSSSGAGAHSDDLSENSFKKSWGKLDNQRKINRILQYVTHLKDLHNLTDAHTKQLK